MIYLNLKLNLNLTNGFAVDKSQVLNPKKTSLLIDYQAINRASDTGLKILGSILILN